MTMQKAVALAHLRVAYEPDDEDDDEVVGIPAPLASPPPLPPPPSGAEGVIVGDAHAASARAVIDILVNAVRFDIARTCGASRPLITEFGGGTIAPVSGRMCDQL